MLPLLKAIYSHKHYPRVECLPCLLSSLVRPEIQTSMYGWPSRLHYVHDLRQKGQVEDPRSVAFEQQAIRRLGMGHKSGVPPKANRVYTMFSYETVKTGIEWKSLATSPNVSAKPIG